MRGSRPPAKPKPRPSNNNSHACAAWLNSRAGSSRISISTVMTALVAPVLTALGLIGSLTRGLVFTIIGAFLIFAAIDSNAHEATGLAGALAVIKGQSYGAFLLGATALGFLSFGLFGLAEAAFRRIDADCATGQASWHRA